MGRVHRYYGIPRRVVCLNYSTAEICAALGVSDKITGVASAEGSLADCKAEYRGAIAKAPFLPSCTSKLNIPSFESVCACRPDLVIGTSYSFNKFGGIADSNDFEEKGIHVYASKATYELNCGFESIHEDILNLGKIFGKEHVGKQLINDMISEEAELKQWLGEREHKPVRVFSFDAYISGKAFTCGQSLENHIIQSAGGINIFGDMPRQFVTVDWSEVAKRNPEVIVVHSFFSDADGIQKIAFLRQITELADTVAIKNNRLFMVGIKNVFPNICAVNTARNFASFFHSISTM